VIHINHKDLELKKAMANAKASIEIEGLKITKESEKLVYERLIGNITEEEFLKRALEIASSANNQ
jgi:hypothetical protein